jgi:hypothetical protein
MISLFLLRLLDLGYRGSSKGNHGDQHRIGKAIGSARVKVHFDVSPAEANGWRYMVERRGKLVNGSRRKIRILDTEWYPTAEQAERKAKAEKRKWTAKL